MFPAQSLTNDGRVVFERPLEDNCHWADIVFVHRMQRCVQPGAFDAVMHCLHVEGEQVEEVIVVEHKNF